MNGKIRCGIGLLTGAGVCGFLGVAVILLHAEWPVAAEVLPAAKLMPWLFGGGLLAGMFGVMLVALGLGDRRPVRRRLEESLQAVCQRRSDDNYQQVNTLQSADPVERRFQQIVMGAARFDACLNTMKITDPVKRREEQCFPPQPPE